MTRRFQETVGELKKGETKHPTIVEKNSDEAEGKRAEKRETRVKPIGMLRQNAHILDRFIAAAVIIIAMYTENDRPPSLENLRAIAFLPHPAWSGEG